ncbi:hypothetical protein BDY21DRAFT_192859 [Lineolata rhizophorae]|uniref:Transcription factor Nrm1/Whi5 n=1 Tax=Lineolata rhizophorae TaxID=578093 RepID=A0A6A6P808_9PEZI|nr:hypothetical protein BDY21DRAFT_192859 [Lineolata rhizophorae]
MASSAKSQDQPAEVASKVLRRAQVSKMTRALQNRLALANVKIKHGWQNLSLETIEPRVEMELKRKRPGSSNETMSDTSSSCISDRLYPVGVLESSPLAPPIFSDDVARANGHHGSKRTKYYSHAAAAAARQPASSSHARAKVRHHHNGRGSWKSAYRLPESSPAYHARRARYPHSSHVPSLSFVSEASTVPDDPVSPVTTDDEDVELPVHSFQADAPHFCSSPPRTPRTPPPGSRSGRSAGARSASRAFNAHGQQRNGQSGEEGADLLLYLATSPSPAHHNRNANNDGGNNPSSASKTPTTAKQRLFAPSTPPPKSTPLPSSMMSTPGGGMSSFPGFGPNTPSAAAFNYTDFLNFTPSPGQAVWKTPVAAAKTPLAGGKEAARRRLNFDGLLPSSSASGGSPNVGGSGSFESKTSTGSTKKETGLGMELGGELVS